ncbi:MAG: putative DNA-invertase from lambdoid prophage Rac, partial [Acetobacteraceae bacterium]|nr:putative DNA-invertase from lambdoid prophage Rac [Acetobacteraceae bacterium]
MKLTDTAYGQVSPMPRTFAYVRVSTVGQTTVNQIQEIEGAGFTSARRVISETVSGSSAIEQRPAFMRLLDKLEQDDVLIVTKLDRLGRNAIDVATTGAGGARSRIQRVGFGKADWDQPTNHHAGS